MHDVCNNNKKVQNHFWFNFFRGSKERKGNLKVEGAHINAVMSECQLKLCITSAAWEETSRGDTSPVLTSPSSSLSNLSIRTASPRTKPHGCPATSALRSRPASRPTRSADAGVTSLKCCQFVMGGGVSPLNTVDVRIP